ncbi:hypothetical protein FRC02_009193 [Tulasnella sp. 418]|nr:hypothetical protein FRC02_009193 [Tulasnella sp. 418]
MSYHSPLLRPSADESMGKTSPFDILPAELISVIFEWALQDERNPPNDGSVSPQLCQRQYHARLAVISQLGQRLREIAINTPSLWSSIHISERSPTSSLARVRSLLLRSKASPLDILLYADEYLKGESSAVELVCREMKRWRSIRVRTDKLDNEGRENLVAILNRAFRRWEPRELESIELSIPSETSHITVSTPRSTALRHLTLTGIAFDWSAHSLAFHQLRQLTIRGLSREAAPSSSSFLRLLSHSPELEVLSLYGVDSSVHDWSLVDPTIIKLANLRTVAFEHVPLPFIHHVLSSLDAPSLNSLRLVPEESNDSVSWVPFVFGFNSVDNFEWSFGKNEAAYSDAGLYQIRAFFSHLIRRLPNVATMKISSPSATQLLQELAVSSPADSTPFPNAVDIEYSNTKDCLELIASTIRSRPTSAPKIKKLSVCAKDVSLPAHAGVSRLQAMDETIDWLGKTVEHLEIRNKQCKNAIRFTFLGWKDCVSHTRNGRRLEYEQEYEE